MEKTTESHRKLKTAKNLLSDFSKRTGLDAANSDSQRRYLWTDAFAVQAFFGMAQHLNDESYKKKALELIDLVHETLGRFHPGDERSGWVSGLPEAEGKQHPTAKGLRIGKKLPERKKDEPFDEQLEWERDGQYFHYLTRWFASLLQAHQETGDSKYVEMATELLQAGGKFIAMEHGEPRMYWKMSTDLSRPLVTSMGAQDPMEGLISAKGIEAVAPGKSSEIKSPANYFEELCRGREWTSTDPLGIGGLLLNTVRAVGISSGNVEVPNSIHPQKLMDESLYSLKAYALVQQPGRSANQRLAFRECGLSLGIRVLYGMRESFESPALNFGELEKYLLLADRIETFWSSPENQEAVTWKDHLDINAISLACSLIANFAPEAFAATVQKQ